MALTHGNTPNDVGIHAGGGRETNEALAGAAVTPGAILVTHATDGSIQEAGAAATSIVGVAGENYAVGKGYRDDHVSGTAVRYYTSPGLRFMGIIKASSAALVYGDLLKTAANGELEKYVAGTDDGSLAVARYAEKADFTPGGSAAYKLCTLVKVGA